MADGRRGDEIERLLALSRRHRAAAKPAREPPAAAAIAAFAAAAWTAPGADAIPDAERTALWRRIAADPAAAADLAWMLHALRPAAGGGAEDETMASDRRRQATAAKALALARARGALRRRRPGKGTALAVAVLAAAVVVVALLWRPAAPAAPVCDFAQYQLDTVRDPGRQVATTAYVRLRLEVQRAAGAVVLLARSEGAQLVVDELFGGRLGAGTTLLPAPGRAPFRVVSTGEVAFFVLARDGPAAFTTGDRAALRGALRDALGTAGFDAAACERAAAALRGGATSCTVRLPPP